MRNNTSSVRQSAIPFIFLLLFIGVAHAMSACDVASQLDFSSNGGLTSADSNWKSLTFIALLVSGLLIAAIYMFGQAVGNMYMINRAKTDFTQFIITVVILVIFSAFVLSICNIDAGQFGLNDANFFDSTKSYFAYAESTAMSSYVKTVDSIMILSAISGYYVQGQIMVIGVYLDITGSFMPFAAFGCAISALQYLSNLVLLSVSVAKAFSVVTEVISVSLLNFLLPVGIVLRCFSPTRELGGIFMSLAIGLFLFYPMMFALSYLIMGQPQPIELPSTEWYSKVIGYTASFSAAGFFSGGQLVLTAATLGPAIDMVSGSIFSALESIGLTLLPVFILPAITWIIIAMLVRNLSSALGAEIDISSLARMI